MKTNHLLLALASAALMASCSSELEVPNAAGEATVTFTATLPGSMSRTFADGKTANKLYYAVYNNGKLLSGEGLSGSKEINLSTTVNLTLAQGLTYDVVFWAQSDTNSPYTFNDADATVTADYTGVTSSNEALDAFYYHEQIEVDGSASKSIELKRPFAQLNIGTNDLTAARAAGMTATAAKVTVTDVCNKLDLLTGAASVADGSSKSENGTYDVTFDTADIPVTKTGDEGEGETFPVSGYQYLAMNYVLVGSDNATSTVSLEVDGIGHKYTGVPLRANYRTNIYGALLTSPADYTVTIIPGFGENDSNVEIWDGTSQSEPQYNEAAQAYVISSASEFAYFLENGGAITASRSAAGPYILTNNLDMGGYTLPTYDDGNTSFWNVNLNGQGHSISNFKCAVHGVNSGVFPAASNISVSNITFSNAIVGDTEYSKYKNIYAGVVVGTGYVVRMTNVKVENCVVNGINKIGGIVGFAAENSAIFTDCSVKDTEINGLGTDAGCAGGFVGYTSGTNDDSSVEIYNGLVSGVTINVPDGKNDASRGNGYYVGTFGNGVKPATISNCELGEGNTMVSNITPVNEYYGSSRDGNAVVNITFDSEEYGTLSYLNSTKYPGLLTDSTKQIYVVRSAEAFKSLHDFYNDVLGNNSAYSYVTHIEADLDMTGYTWTTMWKSVGSVAAGACPGVRIYGHGHTIKNLTTNGSMFGGGLSSFGDDDYSLFKDLTFENLTATGGWHVGAIIGQIATNVKFDNVHIINSNLTGSCNVGGLMGSTGEFSVTPKVTFKDCSVEGCTITATAPENADPTGASGFVGRFLNGSELVSAFEGTNIVKDNTLTQNGLAGGLVYGYTTYSSGWINTGYSDAFSNTHD